MNVIVGTKVIFWEVVGFRDFKIGGYKFFEVVATIILTALVSIIFWLQLLDINLTNFIVIT